MRVFLPSPTALPAFSISGLLHTLGRCSLVTPLRGTSDFMFHGRVSALNAPLYASQKLPALLSTLLQGRLPLVDKSASRSSPPASLCASRLAFSIGVYPPQIPRILACSPQAFHPPHALFTTSPSLTYTPLLHSFALSRPVFCLDQFLRGRSVQSTSPKPFASRIDDRPVPLFSVPNRP